MDKPPVNPDDYRYIGAIMGASQSLLFVWPRSVREAAIRFVFSTISGSILFFIPIEYFGWDRSVEKVLGAAGLIAFVSWFAAGGIIAAASTFSKKKADSIRNANKK